MGIGQECTFAKEQFCPVTTVYTAQSLQFRPVGMKLRKSLLQPLDKSLNLGRQMSPARV